MRPEQLLEGKVRFSRETHVRSRYKVEGFRIHLDLALGEGGDRPMGQSLSQLAFPLYPTSCLRMLRPFITG